MQEQDPVHESLLLGGIHLQNLIPYPLNSRRGRAKQPTTGKEGVLAKGAGILSMHLQVPPDLAPHSVAHSNLTQHALGQEPDN